MYLATRTNQDHIYHDVRIDNLYVNSEVPKLAATNFNTSEILDHQCNYKLAVQGFDIKLLTPVFICPIKEGTNNNINLTNFGVCISYSGSDYSSPVIFVPENLSARLPKAPINNDGLQDLSTDYYSVYTFHAFLDMINTALLTAYNAFNAAHGGVHSSAPYFIYNAVTGLMSLIVDASYADNGTTKIYLNILLLNYVENIPMIFQGYDQPNFKDLYFNIKSYGNNGYPVPSDPTPQKLEFMQEYDGRFLWCNLRSIVLTSSSIKAGPEFLPNAINLNSFSAQGKNTNSYSPNFRNILSYYDVVVDTSGNQGCNWRQNIYYQPNLYKWIDLTSNNPLNSINLEIYYVLNNGQIIPAYIQSGQTCTIKLLFRKADYKD